MPVEPSPEMRPVFASTVLKTHPEDYLVVSIDRAEEEDARIAFKDLKPWSSVTYDHMEVSVVLSVPEWSRLRERFTAYRAEGPYKLITFDIVLDLSLVGFLSVVSSVLADEGVSIYALSTYLRDHILVRKADAGRAVAALERLIDRCRDY
jgi:hypothetical protein